MTRSEAFEILGIAENASHAMVRAAYKMKKEDAGTETERHVYNRAYLVITGTYAAEEEAPKQKAQPTQKRAKSDSKRTETPTPRTANGPSRDLRQKSKDVARASSTAATKPRPREEFHREPALSESAFNNLPELTASRNFASYEARAFGLIKYETGPSGENWDLSISPDDRTFLVASASWVYKWDIASGKLVKGATKVGLRWETHSTSDTYGCDVSSDGRLAATANAAGEVFIWDYRSGEVLHKLRTNGAPRRVKFALNNSAVVVVGWNKIALLWHFETGDEKILPLDFP